MLDMIKPSKSGCIQLGDLKRCRMTPVFFDTFFNLEKYLEHEQRDPFATRENDEVSKKTALTRQTHHQFLTNGYIMARSLM